MTRFRTPPFATMLLGAATCLAVTARAQGPSDAVPVEQEPRHHVVFENAWVRVIDARLPVGDTTLYHTHAADNVPVTIRGGAMTIQPLGGAQQRVTATTGAASLARGGYTHQIANVGPGPLHFLDVEIRTAPSGATHDSADARGAAVTFPTAGHEIVVDDARVRVLRHVVGAESADVHARHVLAVVVPGDDRAHTPPTADVPQPGTYWWRPAGQAERPLPAGTALVEIEIENGRR